MFREIRDFIFFYFANIKDFYGFFKKKQNYLKDSESLQLVKLIDNKINKRQVFKLVSFKNKSDKPIYNFKYITISIGGFSQPVLWKIQNWSILINLISKNLNHKILIIGTKMDIENSNYLLSQNRCNILNLCGKTDIKKMLNIIKYSKLHITNDNGSMHVATIFSKKTLCLFNNHDPIGKWYPLNPNSIILRPKDGVNKLTPYKVYRKLIKFF